MSNISKGEATRKTIIEQARMIFNEKGIAITLDNIALETGMSKSRISNHFPTKDSLFIAILREYEQELAAAAAELYGKGFFESLQAYVDGMSVIMDIQFKYRCGIVYLNMLSPSQHELKQHIRENYERNLQAIRSRLQKLIEQKILEPIILEEPAWSSFVFVYVNLLTQWVIHFDMYDSELDYQVAKMKYIKGVITHLYLPYFTPKGKELAAALRYDK